MADDLIQGVLVGKSGMLTDALETCYQRHPKLRLRVVTDQDSQALDLLRETQPQFVVFETHRVAMIERLRDSSLKLPLIMLAEEDLSPIQMRVILECGTTGGLTTADRVETLSSVIHSVTHGGTQFSSRLEKFLQFDPISRRIDSEHASPLAKLTRRQLQILRPLAEGMSVKETARLLHLSPKSIDSHKYRIMHRLQVHDRVQLTRLAIREGLIEA
jgi:DNA-binding NarL/FixJ family response regulator